MSFEDILKMFKQEQIKEKKYKKEGHILLHKDRLKVFRKSWLKGRTNPLEYKYIYRCSCRGFRKVIKGKENIKATEYDYSTCNVDLMSEDWEVLLWEK